MPFQGEFDTVTAPAVGGVVLSVLSALAAGKNGVPIAAVWAEKRGEGFVFDRMGFAEQLTGKRVLVLEDFLTTGGSVLKVCRAAAALGAKLVGVSVICNRGGVTAAQLGVPRLEALAAIDFSSVPPEECELCRDRVPIVQDIGHGDSYKAEHPDYPGGYIKLAG
ncbi:MAG: phosphoribosyltransferase family protein [Candidatus Dormibacteraceae bacterium]